MQHIGKARLTAIFLAALFASYMLPAGVFQCVQEGGGRSLGWSCHCSSCEILTADAAAADGCQLDCCMQARQARAAMSPEHEGIILEDAGHSGDCCTHVLIRSSVSHAGISTAVLGQAELYALPVVVQTLVISAALRPAGRCIRGSPPTLLADSTLAIACSHLRL